MRTTRLTLLAPALIALGAFGCAKESPAPPPPPVVAVEEAPGQAAAAVTATATVLDVNQKTRVVTLMNSEGEKFHITASPRASA